jgi:ABC-type polysaccharide/polyol phosphate transport system ATPase subunit
MAFLVKLSAVELTYPIYSVRAQSLRNAVLNVAVGGRLLKDGRDVVHVKALTNINFELSDGSRLGIVGHNGAGKTTLLKVLAGVYEPTRGIIEVNGNISSMVNVGLGLDSHITGRENIVNMARRRGFNTRKILSQMSKIIEFSELGPYVDLPFKTYSAGMQARLIFSVATAFEPDILLLDEWLGAGDAAFLEKAQNRMNEILSKSRVMVLASHNIDLIRNTCDKVLVLDGGSQRYFGDTDRWDFTLNEER